MKKSSLGRRSSILGQGRLSNVDRSSVRGTAESKKSFIPKPTSSKNERGSSADRDFMGSSSVKKDQHFSGGLRRSKSFMELNRNSYSQTPTQFSRRNTASSCRKFSESTGRPSSMGAPKSARKESRPVNDRAFQVEAQKRIQNFFLEHAPHLLDNGSIKPMTAAMFANLVQFLISRYDKKIVINRSNLIEEIPNICSQYSYKGKAEKSWLMTVNAPHSWPYVVSFLDWLVELNKCSMIFNVQEGLYPDRVEEEGDGEDLFDFKLLIPHLLSGYITGNSAEEMQLYLNEHKIAMGLDDEEQARLQQEYIDLQKELNDSEDTQEEEKLQSMQSAVAALRNDISNTQAFIYDTENYVGLMNKKHEEKLIQFQEYERKIKVSTERLEQLRLQVSCQEISPERSQEIQDKIATLLQELRQLDQQITEYQNEIYKVDIELVKNRNEFNKIVQIYNKEITINSAKISDLKNGLIEDTSVIFREGSNSNKRFEQQDLALKEVKISLRNKIRDLEMDIHREQLIVQKIEDQKIVHTEENEKVSSQYEQITMEISEIKTELKRDKEQAKINVNELHKKTKSIKEKDENCATSLTSLREELSIIEKKHLTVKEEIDKYVMQSLEFLEEKKENQQEFQRRLEEITKGNLENTLMKLKDLNE